MLLPQLAPVAATPIATAGAWLTLKATAAGMTIGGVALTAVVVVRSPSPDEAAPASPPGVTVHTAGVPGLTDLAPPPPSPAPPASAPIEGSEDRGSDPPSELRETSAEPTARPAQVPVRDPAAQPAPVMDTDPMAQQQATPPPAQPAAQPPVPATAGTMPTLYLIFNGQKIPITKEQFIIGRGLKTSDLAIKDGNISRKHAAIIYHNGAYYIKDLGSVNGIEYSGKRIDSKRIDEADMFHICDYELRFTYT